jgi:iron complex transport system substrate-binding protein
MLAYANEKSKKEKNMKKIIAAALCCVVFTGLLGGCSTSNKETTKQTTVAAQESEAASTDKKEEESKKETSTETETASVNEEQRIAATSVAIVEILDALQVPVAGVPTSQYTLPESVKDATEIGSPMSPDFEVVQSLDPTLVLSVSTLEGDLQQKFQNLSIPVEFLDLSSFDGLTASIEEIGKLVGKESEAAVLSDSLKAKEQEVASKVSGKEKPSVLIIFGAGNNFMVATDGTYIGDLVKRAGGENIITEGTGFIPVDMEALADKNPDVILLMTHANPEESKAAFDKEFETNEAWKHFDAVNNEKVYALETSYFGMSGNLLAGEALEKLIPYLYE